MSTRGGPIAEAVAMIGFLVVVASVWAGGLYERRRRPSSSTPTRTAA